MKGRTRDENQADSGFLTYHKPGTERRHDMNIVYMNEFCKAYFTTASPSSHYGIPALRIDGDLPEFGEFDHDLGPADVLPSGVTAAELCCKTYHLQDEATQTPGLFVWVRVLG
jgi:hypothetical protein